MMISDVSVSEEVMTFFGKLSSTGDEIEIVVEGGTETIPRCCLIDSSTWRISSSVCSSDQAMVIIKNRKQVMKIDPHGLILILLK